MKNESRLEKVIPLLAGSLMALMIVLLIQRDFPLVGHDYRYFISRLIDTNLHIQRNGWGIQWYTPSFGGGLPAFPNPQNLEYSFVQLAAYWVGPWNGILLTTALVSLVGYFYCYKLLTHSLGLDWKAGTLGALFFLGNGFFIEHMIVGQLGYQLFPLGSVVLYLLLDTKHHPLINAMSIALLITMMIHQAGFYLLVILTLMLVITVLVIHIRQASSLNMRRILWLTVTALLLSLPLAGSKLYAVLSLMSHFPRHIVDVYQAGPLQAWLGLIAQFLGVMTLAPMLMLTGQDTDLLSGALSNITGARYGIWETDLAISPVLIAFLFVELARAFVNLRRDGWKRMDPSLAPSWLLLLLTMWVTLGLTFADGWAFSLLKDLPIISSLHVNVRFASAFILPLVVVGAFGMDRFFREGQRTTHFLVFWLLSLAAPLSYFQLSSGIHSREFTVNTGIIDYQHSSPITEISYVQDWDAFAARASSYLSYEPLFGYELQDYAAEVQMGSVYITEDGYFNMTNPVSLVFPELNDTHPFERIKVTERDKLELFLDRGQPDWKIPVLQKFLNFLSLIALAGYVGGILIYVFLRAGPSSKR